MRIVGIRCPIFEVHGRMKIILSGLFRRKGASATESLILSQEVVHCAPRGDDVPLLKL